MRLDFQGLQNRWTADSGLKEFSGSLQGQLWQLQKGSQALPECSGTRLPCSGAPPGLFIVLGVSRGVAESGIIRLPTGSSRVD